MTGPERTRHEVVLWLVCPLALRLPIIRGAIDAIKTEAGAALVLHSLVLSTDADEPDTARIVWETTSE